MPRSGSAGLPRQTHGRYTLGTRIVVSFGLLFVLMLATAALSWDRLRAIDDEALSLSHDSVPGLFYSTSMRAAANQTYALVERAVFVETDPAAVARVLAQLPVAVNQAQQDAAHYEASMYDADDRARFQRFRDAYGRYLPQLMAIARQLPAQRAAAQGAFVQLDAS